MSKFVPEPTVEEMKKYRAYLTRLSKWTALREMSKDRQIGVEHLRRVLRQGGELPSELGDDWEKRVFKSDMFEDPQGGFYPIVENEKWEKRPPADSRPKWEGPRPGEDVVGDALRKAIETYRDRDHLDTSKSFRARLEDEAWQDVTSAVHYGFRHARTRGLAKPLYAMGERVCQDPEFNAGTAQVIGLWLVDSIGLVESFARLRAHLKDESKPLWNELILYRPLWWKIEHQSDGTLTTVEHEITPDLVYREVQRLLDMRKLLPPRKKKAA